MNCGGNRVSVGSHTSELFGVHNRRTTCTSSTGVLAPMASRTSVRVGVSCPALPRHPPGRIDENRDPQVGSVFAVEHDRLRFTVNSAMAAQQASSVFHRHGLNTWWWLISPIHAYGFVSVETRLHLLSFTQGEVVMATHQTACHLAVDLDREPLTAIESAPPCGSCFQDWGRQHG